MIIITTILFGLARGLYEGMIMHPDGVRYHVAFYLYHALGVAMLVAFGRIVWMVSRRRAHWMYLAGLALILWESTEIGYGFGRFGAPRAYEHIAIADIISITITGWRVWVLHAARVLVGVNLLIAGGHRQNADFV